MIISTDTLDSKIESSLYRGVCPGRDTSSTSLFIMNAQLILTRQELCTMLRHSYFVAIVRQTPPNSSSRSLIGSIAYRPYAGPFCVIHVRGDAPFLRNHD